MLNLFYDNNRTFSSSASKIDAYGKLEFDKVDSTAMELQVFEVSRGQTINGFTETELHACIDDRLCLQRTEGFKDFYGNPRCTWLILLPNSGRRDLLCSHRDSSEPIR